MIRVLHLANNAAYSDNPITRAFREEGFAVYEIDWMDCLYNQRMNKKVFFQRIMDSIQNFKPNFVFMQVQHAGIIDYEMAYYINQASPLISWSGDVRDNTDFHELMGKAGVLTLVNNDEDVEKLNNLGYTSDYLQIGFHTDIHHPKHREIGEKKGKIVFIGNNFIHESYPLSSERIELCVALKREFGDDFEVYGAGWEDVGIKSTPCDSKDSTKIYSQYDICINHSHYQRGGYTSDRLLYILGSGSFCISHWYPRMDEEFVDGEHLITYKNIPELIKKCEFWLDEKNILLRERIAKNGCDFVHKECNWNKRVKQLIPLLNKYIPTAMTKSDSWIEALHRISPEKHFSQFGEESFIGHIFNSIGTENKYFVDLGAGNGVDLSNTKLFKDTYGWTGLMVDADNRGNEEVLQAFINADNILDILSKNNVPKDFDFLSIDLDGNDFWILEKILNEYSPRLIMAEFNGTIPLGVCKVMEYNASHTWGNDDYYGASFDAFKKLGNIHGYSTIFSYASTNIYLIRKDLLAEPEKDWSVSYQPLQYHAHNPNGKWITF